MEVGSLVGVEKTNTWPGFRPQIVTCNTRDAITRRDTKSEIGVDSDALVNLDLS